MRLSECGPGDGRNAAFFSGWATLWIDWYGMRPKGSSASGLRHWMGHVRDLQSATAARSVARTRLSLSDGPHCGLFGTECDPRAHPHPAFGIGWATFGICRAQLRPDRWQEPGCLSRTGHTVDYSVRNATQGLIRIQPSALDGPRSGSAERNCGPGGGRNPAFFLGWAALRIGGDGMRPKAGRRPW